MVKDNINALASLQIVLDFIRGNTNIDEAKYKLKILGLDSESAEKVLRNTQRDNVITLNKN
jgi:hypothetical protein